MQKKQSKSSRRSVQYIVRCAMLAALSAALFFVEFPIPLMPPWLKLDLSAIPAMLAGISLGPVAALIVTLIKNLLHLSTSMTFGIGELADMLMTSALILPTAFLYRRKPGWKSLLLGMAIGTVAIAIVGALSNYYFIWPIYVRAMQGGAEALLAQASDGRPWLNSLGKYIALGVIPFNVIKGLFVNGVMLLLYKPLIPILRIDK